MRDTFHAELDELMAGLARLDAEAPDMFEQPGHAPDLRHPLPGPGVVARLLLELAGGPRRTIGH